VPFPGDVDHRGVPPVGGEPVGQRLQRRGRAAVAGHEQHRSGPALGQPARRPRRPTGGRPAAPSRPRGRRRPRGQDGRRPGGGGRGRDRRAPHHCPRPPSLVDCERGAGAVLSREEYLAAWSTWHGGADPAASRLVHGWLSASTPWPAGGRAATCRGDRRGLLVAAVAVVRPHSAAAWLVLAGVLVGLSAVLDGLDGALAIATGRASAAASSSTPPSTGSRGRLRRRALGGRAPGWLAAAFGGCAGCRTTCAPAPDRPASPRPGQLSVWERPTRVVMTGFTLGGAGVVAGLGRGRRPGVTGDAVGVVLGLVGTASWGALRRALDGGRRALRGAGVRRHRAGRARRSRATPRSAPCPSPSPAPSPPTT
jgi:CDP-diacylglycerol--glycerol-3-phosphate 3-phosphatidyltransferase